MSDKRILIVDSDPKNRQVYDALAPGWKLCFSGPGHDAWALVQAGLAAGSPFAVAIVDIGGPVACDGLETAREAGRIDPRLELLLVTSRAEHTLANVVQRVGVPDRLHLLRRPLTPETVGQLVVYLGEKWELTPAKRRAEQSAGQRSVAEQILQDKENFLEDVFRAFPFYDFSSGELAGVIEHVRDVTDRHQAEMALRQGEEKYRALLDNLGVGVAQISPDMEILSLNRQMREWLPHIDVGKRPRCFESFYTPPHQEICSYCPTVKTLNDGEVHEAINENVVAGGGTRNFRIISTPVKDDAGKILSAIEVVEDITEQKQAADELRRQEQLYRTLVESAPS